MNTTYASSAPVELECNKKADARVGSLRQPDSINVALGNVSTQIGARVRSLVEDGDATQLCPGYDFASVFNAPVIVHPLRSRRFQGRAWAKYRSASLPPHWPVSLDLPSEARRGS